MTTIKLEIPNSDPVAMFHMGEALRNIAKENGYVVQDAPVLKVNEEDLKEWSDRFMTEMATEPVYRERSPSIQVLEKQAVRDALAEQAKKNGVSICMNPETYSSVDFEDDELLSPNVTVVEYEPATKLYPDSDKDIAIVTTTASDELIDADGLPHDKRIHSKGATRLNDDTWRMKKKPADKTDEEWAEFVDGVKAELKQLMDIPVATGEALDVLAEIPTTLDELAVDDLEQYVTPNSDVAIELKPIVLPPIKNPFEANPIVNSVTPPTVNSVTPPIVTPPVIAPPVTITPPTDSEMTFPLLMKFITGNNKKLTSETVNQVLNENGIKSLPLLFSRPDLLPQIHAALVKLL